MSDLFADQQTADATWADRAIARVPQIATVKDFWTAVDAMRTRRAALDKATNARISAALRGRYAEITGRYLDGSPVTERIAA